MQLVGRDAAAALLEATGQFDRPVDTSLQLRLSGKVQILTSYPVCVREISREVGGSTIQKKSKPLREIAEREVKRAWYRTLLRMNKRASGL